ncbi:hypothetical protein FA13DRAFT_1171214 [Coprinellus micaceus]|uniref:Uncharacterized protein n=1 Tax=Coprinellus micaceus TaxID=71717 RepID=A0A4Y7RBI9_COPMI|nr:hypothetical protein FA13DRAFT_1171214 [Coprinellus micaceus]
MDEHPLGPQFVSLYFRLGGDESRTPFCLRFRLSRKRTHWPTPNNCDGGCKKRGVLRLGSRSTLPFQVCSVLPMSTLLNVREGSSDKRVRGLVGGSGLAVPILVSYSLVFELRRRSGKFK